MAETGPKEFLPQPELTAALRHATDRLAAARMAALAELGDPDAARARARAARARAVGTLDESLDRFERAARAHGTQVHRTRDAAEARAVVRGILEARGARRLVKSKSMVCEEIGLREDLERHGFEVVETDLGEWLVQLAGQRPSHIIVPAVHLDLEEVRRLLSRVAGEELPRDPRALAAFARAHLRQRFLEADAGLSGGNLLIAETGTVVVVSNEGNARMGTTLPRLHVAVVGVEKVVRTWSDALDVLAVLPRAATGQRMTQYVSFLSGPRRPEDAPGDGPDEVHVVLVDNGRRALVGTPAEELLYCIRCGACMNVCPVYRIMGGHAYETVYPGPIGAALVPHLTGGREGRDLPWASSLCGACREACPVGIQLDDQLIALRAAYPKPRAERWAMAAFARVGGRPRGFAWALGAARLASRRRTLERLPGPAGGWTRTRSLRRLGAPRRLRFLPPRPGAPTNPTPPPPPRAPAPPPAPADPVATFVARWTAAGGHARVVARAELAAQLRALAAPGPVSADPALAVLVPDLPSAEATDAAVGLVAVPAAAAATATMVLPSGPGTERRRSLLPPRVVFVVDAARVHPDLAAAFDALGLLAPGPRPAAVTLVSGPSRSADIADTLVIGVHGPGDAWALVVREGTAP
jgi:L-lactate dehydrogenase complex protein LldF